MNTEPNASHGTIEGKKEELVRDLKSVATDGDALLKGVANSAAEEFAAARTKVEEKLSEARSRLDTARIAVTEKAKGAADATQEYARENPWKAVAVAAAAGLIIGFLISRR